jgi:formylglycine-generating enzyme required for sulfatase activity
MNKMLHFVLRVILIFLTAVTVSAQISDSSMMLIPGGEFMMGKDSERGFDFSPAHRVLVDSFFMDNHEVTNAEYYKFCEKTGHRLPEFWNMDMFRCGEKYPDYPVVGISWYDATDYAVWAGKRLPTEAEWEYAARGGLKDMEYPNGNLWKKERKTNKPGEWLNRTDQVYNDEPNGFGLYHMAGNVWEWTADIYSADYYKTSPMDNPAGPSAGSNMVIRSGSWHSGPVCKKVYYRKGLPSNWVDFAVGFRCVKDLGNH